jgi:hypothetical protein
MLAEGERSASGFGTKEEGVEHIAPFAQRAYDEGDEYFATV